jgi:carbonic anhydrase/acetyltransferase-like protein (isoleucine patch superfamily)
VAQDANLALIVGDNCTIGHKVLLHGCQIGSGSIIGMASTVMNRAFVGAPGDGLCTVAC